MQDVKTNRHLYIGGSDVPIIMGISHFKTRYQLLLEKAQLKEDEFEGNEYTNYGNIMEGKIRQYINTLYRRNFKEDKLEKGDIRCHYDGIDDNIILEIKTTSIIHEKVDDYKVYLVQLLFYMMNANIENGMLAIYKRPEDFNEKFDDERLQIFNIELKNYKCLCKEINECVEQFRIDLKKIKENPFLTEEDLIDKSVVNLAHEVIVLEEKLKDYKEIVKKYEDFKKKLKLSMEESNITHWETPSGIKITLVPDGEDKIIKKFNEKKFKEENENLYNNYLEDKEQKGRSGYVLISLGGNDD